MNGSLFFVTFTFKSMALMKFPGYLMLFLLTFSTVSAQEQFSLFFDSNKADLTKAESARLSQWAINNPKIKIVAINGYTDEDGTSGFNDTLAQKRVSHVFSHITGKVKIREDFKTRSFGELHKHSPNKAENRRVTIYYLLEKDLARENEILGIKDTPKPKPVRHYPPIISFKDPNGSVAEFKLDTVFMNKVDKAKAGEKLTLENLNFQINTFAIVNESRGKLYELLIVMDNNPDLKIEIQGHLCCMPVDRTDLSTQRARAIYKFLEMNKIPKNRIAYKGFGSTQPIYPLPEKDEAQRAANRRVEILVLEN